MAPRRHRRLHAYLFQDRIEAGEQLGATLAVWRDAGALVLGLPRGGVPVAAEVSHQLGAELDVVIARKIGAPHQPELAIGAVTADGGLFLDTSLVGKLGIADDHLDQLIADEREIALQRETLFRHDRPAVRLEQRTVIVVDDGLATGATMLAAVRAIRKQRPQRIEVAVPVGSRQASAALDVVADRVTCLYTPEPFRAVGAFYRDFEQVSDEEVDTILTDFHHDPM